MTIHTKAENETKREAGETALFSLWNSSGVCSQFKPQTLGANSVCAPSPFKSGLRPLHDSAQTPKVKELTDFQAYGLAVQSFGASVADKVIRLQWANGRDVAHLRNDLKSEAEAAALFWFANASRVFGPLAYSRFLAYSIDTQKPILALPHKIETRLRKGREVKRNRYSLRRRAFKACDSLLSRMANKRETVCAWLDEVATETENPNTATRAQIAERCDILRERVNAKAAKGGNRTKGAAKGHLQFIDRLHAYLLASLDGKTYAAQDALRFVCETRETAKETLQIKKNGRFVSTDDKGSVSGSRDVAVKGRVGSTCPAYDKMKRFADFVDVRFDRYVNGFAVLFGELANAKTEQVGTAQDAFAKVKPIGRKSVFKVAVSVSKTYGQSVCKGGYYVVTDSLGQKSFKSFA